MIIGRLNNQAQPYFYKAKMLSFIPNGQEKE
jgi:hypothetical protein